MKILAIDGGGVRGALAVNLLARLTDRLPDFLAQIDLLVGTSTGSFIILGLAYGLKIEKLVDLYTVDKLKSVFEPSYINLVRARYDRTGLKKLLTTVFPPELKLKELAKQVVVPAFKFVGPGKRTTVLLNNLPDSDQAEKTVLQSALASSAAPTYFPAYNQYIDGGVTVNNPSLAALGISREKLEIPLAEIKLFSLGTGLKPNRIKETENWGILQWAINPTPPPRFPLLDMLIEGSKETTAKLSSQLLGTDYFRLNPALSASISLDDYRQVPQLIKLANNYNLQPAISWLKENWF